MGFIHSLGWKLQGALEHTIWEMRPFTKISICLLDGDFQW